MLPYASYLRVYEPLGSLHASVRAWATSDEGSITGSGLTLDSEQRTVLTRLVASAALDIAPDQMPGAYVLRAAGQDYYCPLDMSLRSWLSLTSLVESIGDTTVTLLFAPDTLAMAGEDFLRWRRDHPQAVPHIRQSAWGIPRTWFVTVVEDEREMYDEGDLTSVRYRARILDARRRVESAHAVLRTVIDDSELLVDLLDLGAWLESFDETSWVELDYAGVAGLLGDRLSCDQSARDIQVALDALRREDFGTAGDAYRTFEARWRVVNAFERAN